MVDLCFSVTSITALFQLADLIFYVCPLKLELSLCACRAAVREAAVSSPVSCLYLQDEVFQIGAPCLFL